MPEPMPMPAAPADGHTAVTDAFTARDPHATPLSEVLFSVPSIVQRGVVYLISAMLVFGLGLLYFGKVNVIVTAKGIVVPKGASLRVEASEGGIVTEVLAQVGERLEAGAPIVRLDPTRSDMSIAALTRKQQLLETRLAGQRAAAAATESCLENPERFLREDKQLDTFGSVGPAFDALNTAWLSLQRAILSKDQETPRKKEALRQSIEVAKERVQTLVNAKQATVWELTEADKDLAQKKNRLEEFRQLVERGIYAQVDLEAEQERFHTAEVAREAIRQRAGQTELEIATERLRVTELESKIRSDDLDVQGRYQVAVVQHRQSLANLRQALQDLRLEIDKTDDQLQDTRDELQIAKRQLSDTTITMPVSGTLVEVDFKNPGETIPSGGVVATVVADGAPLMINALVANSDIGFVSEGLEARVKVDAYPYQQFGTVSGSVMQIFPNVGKDENFKVTLSLPEGKISYKKREIQLFPGLTVEAEIMTRKERLFWFLLKQRT